MSRLDLRLKTYSADERETFKCQARNTGPIKVKRQEL